MEGMIDDKKKMEGTKVVDDVKNIERNEHVVNDRIIHIFKENYSEDNDKNYLAQDFDLSFSTSQLLSDFSEEQGLDSLQEKKI